MQKSVDIITHISVENLGNILHVLEELPVALQYYQAGINDYQSIRNNPADLLIVLGGPVGVYQKHDYPFLSETIEIIQERYQNQQAVLGVCLGAQLLAEAIGGTVYKGTKPEIGWHKIQINQDINGNPLTMFEDVPVVQWHGDTFDLPDDIEILASSDLYTNQAFRLGDKFLGLQFHPEVTEDGMERWYIAHAHQIEQMPTLNVAQLRAETERNMAQQQAKAHQLWREWLPQALAL